MMTEAEGRFFSRGRGYRVLARGPQFFHVHEIFRKKNACSWPYLTNNNGHQPAAGDLKNHLGTGMPGSVTFLLCASDSR